MLFQRKVQDRRSRDLRQLGRSAGLTVTACRGFRGSLKEA